MKYGLFVGENAHYAVNAAKNGRAIFVASVTPQKVLFF